MNVYLVKAKNEAIKLVKEYFSDRGRWHQKWYLRLNGSYLLILLSPVECSIYQRDTGYNSNGYWKQDFCFQGIRKWHN